MAIESEKMVYRVFRCVSIGCIIAVQIVAGYGLWLSLH